MNPTFKARIESIRRGEVPEGYKRTKAGIMPVSWCKEKTYQAKDLFVSVSDKKYGGTLEVLSVTQDRGIVPRRLVDIDIKYDDSNLGTYKKVDKGDFVISLRSFQGGIEYSDYVGIVSPAYTVVRSKQKIVAGYYKAYFKTKDFIKRLNIGTYGIRDGKQVSFDDFGDMVLQYPPVNEQEKIADILAGQDRVIALKEQLLAEKQKQKKYLMQQLLTGKKRLPGFSGEWIVSRLEDLFSERVETNCAELRLLAITSGQGVIPRDELELKDNSSEDKSKYKKICVGDIGYNTMRMWQGVSAFSNYEGIVSPAYTILKSNSEIDAKFFAYLFKLPSIIFLFFRYSQGLVDDTRNLKYENLKRIRVLFPQDKKEQTAIAEILSTADKEIELLKKDIEQEKLKKKSLMQLLLTGIVRVPV